MLLLLKAAILFHVSLRLLPNQFIGGCALVLAMGGTTVSGCRYGYEQSTGEHSDLGGAAGGPESPAAGGNASTGGDASTGGTGTGGQNLGGAGGDSPCPGNGCAPTLPIVDASLMLWLDGADAGTLIGAPFVSEWRDKSPRNHHVAQMDSMKRPALVDAALNGRSVLRFDGVDDSLFADNSDGRFDAEELSVFLVVSPEWVSDLIDNPAPLAIRGDNSGATRISFHVSGRKDNFQNFNGVFQQFSPETLPTGEAQLLEFSFERVDALMLTEHHLNGRLTNTDDDNSFGTLLQPLRVGAAQDDFEHFEGLVAEILVYDRPLAAAERQDVEAYIEQKWAIPMQKE